MATSTSTKSKTAPKVAEPEAPEPEAPEETTVAPDGGTPEELAAVATFGISLATLRAIRGIPEHVAHAVVDSYDPHAGICGACHPQGWPARDADYSECEHGVVTRHGYEDKVAAAA